MNSNLIRRLEIIRRYRHPTDPIIKFDDNKNIELLSTQINWKTYVLCTLFAFSVPVYIILNNLSISSIAIAIIWFFLWYYRLYSELLADNSIIINTENKTIKIKRNSNLMSFIGFRKDMTFAFSDINSVSIKIKSITKYNVKQRIMLSLTNNKAVIMTDFYDINNGDKFRNVLLELMDLSNSNKK